MSYWSWLAPVVGPILAIARHANPWRPRLRCGLEVHRDPHMTSTGPLHVYFTLEERAHDEDPRVLSVSGVLTRRDGSRIRQYNNLEPTSFAYRTEGSGTARSPRHLVYLPLPSGWTKPYNFDITNLEDLREKLAGGPGVLRMKVRAQGLRRRRPFVVTLRVDGDGVAWKKRWSVGPEMHSRP